MNKAVGRTPRLTIELRPDQACRLNIIPWGVKRPLFQSIVDNLLAVLEEMPPKDQSAFYGGLITGSIKLEDFWHDNRKPAPVNTADDARGRALHYTRSTYIEDSLQEGREDREE